MYLFEDAARQYRKDTFQLSDKDSALVYSKICKEFEKNGFSVFRFAIPSTQQASDAVNEDNNQI